MLGGTARRHPDIDSRVPPLSVHPVSDREDFIAVVTRDTDFCSERNAVHGDLR